MSYLTLDEYQRKWIFTHQSMPVPEQDLEQIKPMKQARAAQLWKENISTQSPDAERVAEFIDWQDDVTVYFCYEKYNVIETKWSIFKKHWKNFLFYDDGPILIGRRRKESLWFDSDDKVKLGYRG